MYYITVRQSPSYYQMTLEDLLFGEDKPAVVNYNVANTKTYEVSKINDKFLNRVDVDRLIEVLSKFVDGTQSLREKPRHDLYREFYVPKKSGGLRKIDAPEPELMNALRNLKTIFENDFQALYHTSAFAYIKHRGTIECMKRHQANESKWFAKYDLHDFFGSTTPEFVTNMFAMVFPFSEVIKNNVGRDIFKKAIDLAFLDGGLPQGTPISPLITNIMMIPVDFILTNTLRFYNEQHFVYTRYADDFQVSSRYTFNFREIEDLIKSILQKFGAPFKLNSAKTRYGSSAGSNWNLGVMLNKDNQLTVGHKKKKQFQAMISSYIMDKQHGKGWDKSDIQVMDGYRNYYRMVEGEVIDKIVEHIGDKFKVDVVAMIKADLSRGE